MAFDKTSYDNEWKRVNKDRVSFLIPKGRKAEIQLEAQIRGISVNALIIEALENYYGMNLT